MAWATVIGGMAGVIQAVAALLYVWAILRGTTRPDRVTWWLLALIFWVYTATYFALGARETIFLPLAAAIVYTLIAFLSVTHGAGEMRLSRMQWLALLASLGALGVWYASGAPLIALIAEMGAETFALIPTAYKAWLEPESEDVLAWGLATFASFINIFAVTTWTFALAAYPLYVFLTNLPIFFIILRPLLFFNRLSA